MLSNKDKYTILNNLSQKVFCVAVKTSMWGGSRKTEILDQQVREIIHLSSPANCQLTHKIKVYSPPGCLVGTVKNNLTFLKPVLTIYDAAKNKVFKIKGPIRHCSFGGEDVDFKVFSVDKKLEVGCISKQWSRLLKELFTDANNFCISFPLDLDVRMKAMILGACIFIDSIYFHM